MAASTREEAQRRRREAREHRRATAATPVEQPGGVADGADGDSSASAGPTKTLKHAAGTAVAGAVVAGLAGAAKAVLDRRGSEPASDDDEPAGRRSEAPEPRGDDDEPQAPRAAEHGVEPESASEPEPRAEQATDEPDGDEGAGEPQAPQAGEDGVEPESASGPEPRAEQATDQLDEDEAADKPEESDEPPSGVPAGEAAEIVDTAREQLRRLLGGEPESISGFEHSDGRWAIDFEVVEMHRIPESTDVLCSYEVVLDDDRQVVQVTRKRRYRRSQVDEA